MKPILFILAIILGFFNYAQHTDAFKSLSALAGGTWQMKTSKGFIDERWKIISPTELYSTGFRVIGKDTTIEEKVRVIKKGDDIYYVPTVKDQNGGKEVYFKLTSTEKGEFIFSNPAHDFPQRVIYQIISRDSLHAWIDGEVKGKFIKQDFYYSRVK